MSIPEAGKLRFPDRNMWARDGTCGAARGGNGPAPPALRRMRLLTPDVIGYAAGVLSAFSFLPQLLKAWRDPDPRAVSARTYLAAMAAFCLWILYGFMIGSLPIMIFNAISLALAGAILALRLSKGAQSPRR